MVSTGLFVFEYIRENKTTDSDEICEFVEINAHNIIEDTIEHLNNLENMSDENEGPGDSSDDWPYKEDDDR